MTGRRDELLKVLEKHFDIGVATRLAGYIQDTYSKGAELRVEETDDCFLILLDNEAIIATLTRGEAVLLCADIKNALTLTE